MTNPFEDIIETEQNTTLSKPWYLYYEADGEKYALHFSTQKDRDTEYKRLKSISDFNQRVTTCIIGHIIIDFRLK